MKTIVLTFLVLGVATTVLAGYDAGYSKVNDDDGSREVEQQIQTGSSNSVASSSHNSQNQVKGDGSKEYYRETPVYQPAPKYKEVTYKVPVKTETIQKVEKVEKVDTVGKAATVEKAKSAY